MVITVLKGLILILLLRIGKKLSFVLTGAFDCCIDYFWFVIWHQQSLTLTKVEWLAHLNCLNVWCVACWIKSHVSLNATLSVYDDVSLLTGVFYCCIGVAVYTVTDVSVNARGLITAIIAVWSTTLQQYVSFCTSVCRFLIHHRTTKIDWYPFYLQLVVSLLLHTLSLFKGQYSTVVTMILVYPAKLSIISSCQIIHWCCCCFRI